jgi:hypothetical protein
MRLLDGQWNEPHSVGPDAWIRFTISPRWGMRCSVWREKIVLPSTTTSSTPVPAKLILGVRFSCFLMSRLRRPASRRVLIQVTQRLISMFMAPRYIA